MLLIDADFLIGLYFDKDFHHTSCNKIATRISEPLIISWDVIDEAATKLRYFLDKATALRMITRIQTENMPIVFTDKSLMDKAVRIFESISNSKVSLTDCINIAIAQEKKITHILSFDKIYEKNGLKLFK